MAAASELRGFVFVITLQMHYSLSFYLQFFYELEFCLKDFTLSYY